MSANFTTPDPSTTPTAGTTPAAYNEPAHQGNRNDLNRNDHTTHHTGHDESLTGKGIVMRVLGVLVAVALVTWIAAALLDEQFMDLYWWTLLGGVTALIVDFVLHSVLRKKS